MKAAKGGGLGEKENFSVDKRQVVGIFDKLAKILF